MYLRVEPEFFFIEVVMLQESLQEYLNSFCDSGSYLIQRALEHPSSSTTSLIFILHSNSSKSETGDELENVLPISLYWCISTGFIYEKFGSNGYAF